MIGRLQERLTGEMEELRRTQRFRELRGASGVDFSSNDYLGFSADPAVLEAVAAAALCGVGHGSTGSRLLSGNGREQVGAEDLFARFMGRERALLFGSGYMANLALLSTLPGRHDLIILDSASHASLKEGARASLAARRTFRHNDLDALRSALRDREEFAEVFVVVEGVYSMDGDLADAAAIAAVCGERGAHLVVDEAHATGLYGPGLRGVHEAAGVLPLATVHPCGKALGSGGAFIAADALVIEYLVNAARPFLFSTAPSPLQAVALATVVERLRTAHDRTELLFSRVARLREGLRGLTSWRTIDSSSPIVPVIVGDDETAVRAARYLNDRGLDVRPIRPPTVPAGSSRLRISVTVRRTEEEIDRLCDTLLAAEQAIAGGAE